MTSEGKNMSTGFPEYDKYDGLSLAELVRRREVKPAELVEEAIGRIERLNPKLNAVIYKMYEQARQTAESNLPDGPFQGVPFLLKDLVGCVKGVPLRNGSRFFKEYVPDHDSEIIKRFRKAGVIFAGKTNTPEFGLAFVTEPELFGAALNPWDPNRTPGGSSGGSAAAVAVRMVPLAYASDGGGSIRVPSSCCGVFGLKPTRGRNPAGPDFGDLWRGFACEHVITRSVRDSAAMLDATAGPDTGAPYWAEPPQRSFLSEVGTDPGKLRIAFTAEPFFGSRVDEDCVKGLEATVKLCQDLGHEVADATLPIDGKALARAFLTVICSETRATIEQAGALMSRKGKYKDFEVATWACSLLGKALHGSDLSAALNLVQQAGRKIGEFFTQYDMLLTPTLASPPLVTGATKIKGVQLVLLKLLGRLNASIIIPGTKAVNMFAAQTFEFAAYTPLFNATGQPAMSVPLYWNDEGLPIGMQFVGRYGDEAALFRLAGQLERARPWADRLPPVCIQ
jgi:amidase